MHHLRMGSTVSENRIHLMLYMLTKAVATPNKSMHDERSSCTPERLYDPSLYVKVPRHPVDALEWSSRSTSANRTLRIPLRLPLSRMVAIATRGVCREVLNTKSRSGLCPCKPFTSAFVAGSPI